MNQASTDSASAMKIWPGKLALLRLPRSAENDEEAGEPVAASRRARRETGSPAQA